MDSALASMYSSIPSNKFYPPHIDDKQSLFRSRLIETILPKKGREKKAIAIEAQAGQGKTTLAYQYITHNRYRHIWYQIGKEDSDPVCLLSSLLHNLTTNLGNFSCTQLSDIISKGEIGPLDLERCANILLVDIDTYLSDNLYIVFDDLHLIGNARLTNSLLSYMLDTSPPKLRFVLISRHPLELKSKTIRNRNAISYLSTRDLALNSHEIEMLFNDVYKRSISVTDAIKIEQLTSGWVMGIALAAHPMSGSKSLEKESDQVSLFQFRNQKHMLEYFQDEIFSHIPERLHIPFLKLSFIDEINVELAKRITGLADIGKTLTELTEENLFIYNFDKAYTTFRFHHLFQEFLQIRAKKTLNDCQVNEIFSESASFFLERECIDKALSCYHQGGNYEQMDTLLRRHGVDILAQNRTLTIFALLQLIPEGTLLDYAWLTLFSGILQSDFQPQKTLPHLEAARLLFVESHEEIGELLAIATILYYHFVVSGRYCTGASLLPRTVELLENNKDSLSKHLKVLVMRNLAAGFCFFSADMVNAREYIAQAREIAIANSIRNFMASTVFIQAYIELLTGNLAKFRQEVELSFSLLNDPLVCMSNKLTLRIMHICNLSMHGDIQNYFHQQRLISQSIDEKIVKQTVAAPYFFVWGCSCFTSIGETAKALEIINQGINVSSTAKSDHMLSQLLQWQAYILAIHGNRTSAAVKIRESTKLREVAGGPFYQSFHFIMAGCVYAKLKKKKQAKDAFNRALTLAETIPSPYLAACCLMQRSAFLQASHGASSALKDLEKGLGIMENNGYNHFWGWEPEAMLKILQLAVTSNIHKSFSQRLALQRLKIHITEAGELKPLLQITLLDGFSIGLHKKTCLTMDRFTPLQRELLSLLLISKKKKIGQEKIQLILWPDSSPEKSRKKFDTLLGRLRITLSENLPLPIKDYLVLNKGILCLKYAISDIEEFEKNCKEGLRHCTRNEYWQAGNRFNQALSLWKGSRPSDIAHNDAVYSHEDSLLVLFEKTSLRWARVLNDTGRRTEAIAVINNLLKSCALSEKGVLALCRLYSNTNQPLKVRETLNKYGDSLQTHEYEQEEIDAIIDGITERLCRN